MFYEQNMDKDLRLGDILYGIVNPTPVLKYLDSIHDYSLNILIPRFSVVMTPCCSIENKEICIAPLMQLRPAFLLNPYFIENFTNINKKMEPMQAVPPIAWEKMDHAEKARRLSVGSAYTLYEIFVFDGHDVLPQYSLSYKGENITTNCYMVDFKSIYKINCDIIIRGNATMYKQKQLQLSVVTRTLLRDKITFYYARIPTEDQVS